MPATTQRQEHRRARSAAVNAKGKPYFYHHKTSASVVSSAMATQDHSTTAGYMSRNPGNESTDSLLETPPLSPPTHEQGHVHGYGISSDVSSASGPHGPTSMSLLGPASGLGLVLGTGQNLGKSTHGDGGGVPDIPGFPTYAECKRIEDAYLASLSHRKQPKALITQALFDDIWDVLHDADGASSGSHPNGNGPGGGGGSNGGGSGGGARGTPQFRFWVRKMFALEWPQTALMGPLSRTSLARAPVVVHDARPVAVREQLYEVLCYCHALAHHGGRDKTCAVVRAHYSWVPKELTAQFVKACPTCTVKRSGNPDLVAMMKQQVSGRGVMYGLSGGGLGDGGAALVHPSMQPVKQQGEMQMDYTGVPYWGPGPNDPAFWTPVELSRIEPAAVKEDDEVSIRARPSSLMDIPQPCQQTDLAMPSECAQDSTVSHIHSHSRSGFGSGSGSGSGSGAVSGSGSGAVSGSVYSFGTSSDAAPVSDSTSHGCEDDSGSSIGIVPPFDGQWYTSHAQNLISGAYMNQSGSSGFLESNLACATTMVPGLTLPPLMKALSEGTVGNDVPILLSPLKQYPRMHPPSAVQDMHIDPALLMDSFIDYSGGEGDGDGDGDFSSGPSTPQKSSQMRTPRQTPQRLAPSKRTPSHARGGGSFSNRILSAPPTQRGGKKGRAAPPAPLDFSNLLDIGLSPDRLLLRVQSSPLPTPTLATFNALRVGADRYSGTVSSWRGSAFVSSTPDSVTMSDASLSLSTTPMSGSDGDGPANTSVGSAGSGDEPMVITPPRFAVGTPFLGYGEEDDDVWSGAAELGFPPLGLYEEPKWLDDAVHEDEEMCDPV